MQIPSQELMTKDNVTIHVDAVAFYLVEDPLKALCNVEDCNAAVSEAAQVCTSWMARFPSLLLRDKGTYIPLRQTSVRDQLSRATFDEVLHD